MGHLFISYSHKDKAYAHKLAKELGARGFNAWIDDRLDYGTRWLQVIQDQLDACDGFIVIVSKNSSKSKWVENEVARAQRKGKPIFPLLLSGDMWLSLEGTQYVDVRDESLPPEKFYECLELVTSKSDVQTLEIKTGSTARITNPGRDRIIHIELGQILRITVLFTLVAVFAILSIRYLPLSFPPANTTLTWTLNNAQLGTPTATPSPTETITPTLTPSLTPTPRGIVDTSKLFGWVPNFEYAKADPELSGMDIDQTENALKFSYGVGVDGYVIITQSVDPRDLEGTSGVSFVYKGTGKRNTVEFKLMLKYPDCPGDTTYGMIWHRATNTDGEWKVMKAPYEGVQDSDHIKCWGPPADCAAHPHVDVTKVVRLDFAVSNKPGDETGSGWVLIKDVFGIKP